MDLLLTAVFENGFSEMYLPNVNNKTLQMDIKPAISGFHQDIALPLEVWDGAWSLSSSSQFTIMMNEAPLQKTALEPGMLMNCEVHGADDMVFSLTVDEVDDGNTQFEKYFLDPNVVLRVNIGSDEENRVCCANRFISPNHAEITFEGGRALVRDLNSVNGTFINGRLLSGEKPLQYGDIIYIIGLKIVYLGNILAINNPRGEITVRDMNPIRIPQMEDEAEAAPSGADTAYFLRTPRMLQPLNTDTFQIEKCPARQNQKKQPLLFTIGPAFTMVIPMAVGAIMSMGDGGLGGAGLVMSCGAAGIGALWAVMNANYQKKETAENEQKRTNTYMNYLTRMTAKIQEKMQYNRGVLQAQYPSAGEVVGFAVDGSHRLWEKSANQSDFLKPCLGIGDIPSPNAIETPKEQAMAEHDPLNDKVDEIEQSMSVLREVPVALSLYDNLLTGIVCDDAARRMSLCNVVAAQLAGSHPYTDLRLCFVYPSAAADDWAFARWLPHTWTPDGKLRMLCCDQQSVGDVMFFLHGVIRDRLELANERKDDGGEKTLPHYVVMVADWSLLEEEPIAKYLLNPTRELGISVVLAVESMDKLPIGCTTIIQDNDAFRGFYSSVSAFGYQPTQYDTLGRAEMEAFARSLSNYHVRETGTSSAIPEVLTFLDMYRTSRVDELDMMHKWLENRTYESMRSMVGYKSGNQPLYLDIHEKYHGPHGLVAGTTGSGKSETLQSYILSLVVNYHPHEVAFILIDYKGGGMAQSFVGLPHLSGVITNLGGNATNRALLSINAEIKNRQRIFNEYKVKHIDAYIELYRSGVASEPMPHLLIIADEFAELKKEQPEFVRALVSAARVGRSLGVNLILATQKPSGVVDDEIWSNTRFRLCLRVADKQDSNEMLKRPDAAFITGTGRGFFQVGNDEIFEEFQSGWSGAEYEPDTPFTDDKNTRVEMLSLIGKNAVPKRKKEKKSDNIAKVTQLDAVVKYAAKIAEENKIPAIKQIWLAPLPARLYLEDLPLAEKPAGFSLVLPVGFADSPETQSQYPVYVDFLADGNLLVCGAAGSGKTTLLQTLVYGAITRYTPDEVNLYIADFSSRTMAVFGSVPHVGGVMFEGDDEKISDTFELMQRTLARRKSEFSQQGIGSFKEYVTQKADCPAIVFIIDNFVAFNESYEQYDDTLVQLSREGASYGIYIVASANNSGDLRSRLRQNFTSGIALQMADRYEYEAVLGDRTEILPEGRIAGRGLIKAPAPLEFQTALCVREEEGASLAQTLRRVFEGMRFDAAQKARRVGEEPEEVTFESFVAREDVSGLDDALLPLGMDNEEERPVCTGLEDTFCYTVGGAPGTGKTNFLRYLARYCKRGKNKVYLFDGADGELEAFAQQAGLDGYVNDEDALFTLMENVLVPQFSKRNELVAAARDAGKDLVKALAKFDRIIFLINDIEHFMNCVYADTSDMHGFVEVALEKGMSHKIQFFAGITPDNYTDLARFAAMRTYAGYARGMHLGGMLDQQYILRFEDMSSADNVRQLPPGTAWATDETGAVRRVATPLCGQSEEE